MKKLSISGELKNVIVEMKLLTWQIVCRKNNHECKLSFLRAQACVSLQTYRILCLLLGYLIIRCILEEYNALLMDGSVRQESSYSSTSWGYFLIATMSIIFPQ